MRNKIIALCVTLLLCNICYGTAYVRYVNTGSSGGDGTTNGVSGVNAAYVSLPAAEDAMDGVLISGDSLEIHCNRTNGGGPDVATYFYGFAQGTTVTVTQDDFPSDGTFDKSRYYITSTNTTNSSIYLRMYNITLYHMQIESIVTTSGHGIYCRGLSDVNTVSITIDSCIIDGNCAGTGSSYGITGEDGDVLIKNTVVHGFLSSDNPSDTGFRGIYKVSGTGHNVSMLNSVVCDNYNGIYQNSENAYTVTNCAVFNNTDDIAGTVTLTYCAGDDTNFDTGTGNIRWTSGSTDWTANFKSYTTGDYTPVLDSSIYHTGTDLDLTLDLAGNAWHATTPSIGAFEYLAESPPALTGKARIYIIN